MSSLSQHRDDYPTVPTRDKSNPYYMCAFCGRTMPAINGEVRKHSSHCQWRQWVELGAHGANPKPTGSL